jgi:hypothetical protein
MKNVLVVTIALTLTACATGNTFEYARLGMSEAEMVRLAGSPDSVIAAYPLTKDTVERVYEYRSSCYACWWGEYNEPHWFFFVNNKLERWGRPGDHLRYVAY